MMTTEPLLFWPEGCNPRSPEACMTIVHLLEERGLFRLVDRVPNVAGSRIKYETSSTLGVLDTMSYKGWHKGLFSDEQLATICAEILHELAIIEASGKYTRKEQVPFSLVARRNIVVAGYGVNPRDPLELFRFLTTPTFRIPRVGCDLPRNLADNHPLVPSGLQQVDRFSRDTRLFFESKHSSSVIRKHRDDDDSETLPFNMFKVAGSRRVITASSGVDDDEESGDEDDDLSFLAGTFAHSQYLSGCLAGDILARSPAQLDLAIALLQFVSTINPTTIKCFYPGEIASWIIAMLALGFGIAPADAMRIKTDRVEVENSSNYPACLDLHHSRLILLPGNGYEESIYRRIQRGASIEVQLQGVMAQLCRSLAVHSFGKTQLEDFIENPAVDRFVENICLRLKGEYIPVSGRDISPQLMRIASANKFAALIFANVAPAHHALLCCKASNPWRSDSNYINVGRKRLQVSLSNIWKSLWEMAECNPDGQIPEVISPQQVGAVVPSVSQFFDAIKFYEHTR